MSIEKIEQYFNKPGRWNAELLLLRSLLKKTKLTEAFKWYQACYIWENKNVAIVSSFKDYCIIGFFKGSLLKDDSGLLTQPGKHTQLGRQMRFTGIEEIKKNEKVILAYLKEAIDVEKSGIKPVMKNTDQYETPEEWRLTLKKNPKLKKAFDALTPGRQRGYLLHFSQPKQSTTRFSRIEKCQSMILEGKGLNDR